MVKYWIWLEARKHSNNARKRRLLAAFPDAKSIWAADALALERVGELNPQAIRSLMDKSLEEAEKILSLCKKLGISCLTWDDPAYPDKLRSILNPPLVLYYKGALPDFDREATVGIVGTRKVSAYGQKMAAQFGREIAACGGIVVSGMADGVDGISMEHALKAGGIAVGVLGHGPERIYPAAAHRLYGAVEKQGCLLSEFPPGTQPGTWTFPKRNRIISGLSDAVLVVEAPEKSGALITADYAKEQGRALYAVPGSLDLSTGVGSNQLLRDGAAAAMDGWQILAPLQERYPRLHPAAKQDFPMSDKKSVDKRPAKAYSCVGANLSEDAQRLLDAYRAGQEDTDLLVMQLNMSVSRLMVLRTELELKGFTLPPL